MDLATRSVTTVDLPSGGFLVLDHVTEAHIERPFYAVMAIDRPFFTVNATTIYGAVVLCGTWRVIPVNGFGPGDPESPLWRSAEAAARSFLVDLRARLADLDR